MLLPAAPPSHCSHAAGARAPNRPCRQSCRVAWRRRITTHAAASTSPQQATQHGQQQHRGHVLVMPAFYTGAERFKPLVEDLRGLGFNAALPPIRWYNWVPTLGGRNMRPILDRSDYALTQLLRGYQVTKEGGYEVPLPCEPSAADWAEEMRDASKGARPLLDLPGAHWDGSERAAIVASSASGWIARILLATSGPSYGGKVYHGAKRVHTLVTLGTPHISSEPVTLRNINWVNTHHPGCSEAGVRYIAVGSKLVQGQAWLNGRVQDLAYQSYALCCGDGSSWGDGVTPLSCALGLPGAKHIVLEGAEHSPIGGKPWYGTSGPFLDAWVDWLVPSTTGDALAQATATSRNSATNAEPKVA